MAETQLERLFDADLYGKLNPDLGAAGLTEPDQLLEHARNFGVREGRKFSSLVDLKSYSSLYPDLAAAGVTDFEGLLNHLQTYGLQEERRVSLVVDLNFYSSTYSDLGAAGLTSFSQLLEHLQVFGLKEGRRFSRFIDLTFYAQNNPDLAAAGLTTPDELLNHLQEFGIKEGRPLAADVDLKAYRARYGDLQAAFGSDWTKLFQHLIEFGFQEGRAYDPNDAPIVAQPMADATATAGGGINIKLPDGIFADADAVDAPTLTATLEDGSPLPSWLKFDPATQTFSGTPPNTDSGTLSIKVTLTDILGASASQTFALVVGGGTGGTDTGTPPPSGTETPPPTPPANNPPIAGAIANQLAQVIPGLAFNFTVPAGTFSDPDGEILTYTASQEDGSPLPSWLKFNPDTLTFSGLPAATDGGTVNIRLTAIDPLSQSASSTFALKVNRFPLLNITAPIANQTAMIGTAFSYSFPADTFSDPDGDVLTYTAQLVDTKGNPVTPSVDANGDRLPDWLTFDPATYTFSGTPTAADVAGLNIQVIATDTSGLPATNTFRLGVGVEGIVRAMFDAYELASLNGNATPVLQFLTTDPDDVADTNGDGNADNPVSTDVDGDGIVNITWNIPGDVGRVPPSGTFIGSDVSEYFRRANALYALIDPTEPSDTDDGLDVLEVIPSPTNPNRVAVRVNKEGLAAQTGKLFTSDFTYLITVDANGKISSLDGYYNTYPLAASIADQPGPAIPSDDPLTAKPATVDLNADAAAAQAVAEGVWTALINNNFNPADPNSFGNLNDPNATWSFAVGGPSFLPYVGAATGVTTNGQPLAGDFSNVGPVLTELLLPLGSVVTPGALAIQESFVQGNRVLVHLKETGATAIETGRQYDLDLLSWFTIENGQVTSNQVIVDTYKTVDALRPGNLFPLSPEPIQTRHAPPYFVTGSGQNNLVTAYDQQLNYIGVLGQANAADTGELLLGPTGVTYGADGDLYVNTSLRRTDNKLTNGVLRFDGVSGELIDSPANPLGNDYFGDAYFDLATFSTDLATTGSATGFYGPVIYADTNLPYNPAEGPPRDPSLLIPGLAIPAGIKFGPDGDLYVTSAYASRVMRYDGETGALKGAFAMRPNGQPNNLYEIGVGLPDLTLIMFGPDGNLYACSIRSDPDGNEANGTGSIIRFAGPNQPNAGQILGAGTFADLGIFGQANNQETGGALIEPTSMAFGPDSNLYVASGATGLIVKFAGPFAANPGEFMGVYADVQKDVKNRRGGVAQTYPFALTGIGFTPEGDLLIGSSLRNERGLPINGSEISRYSGPNSATPGQYIGPYGDLTTELSRLLNPTTPEFLFTKNSTEKPDGSLTQRFPQISFVAGVNIDGASGASGSDGADVLAAFDQDGKFLKFIGEEPAGQNNIPLDGISGIVLSPNGKILVSSQLSNQVLEFNSLTGEYVGVFGQANQTDSGLTSPAGLFVGPNNDLYVVDQGNERILRFNGYTGELVGDVNGDGTQDGVPIQGNKADALVDRFTGIAFGPDGRIYVGYNPPANPDDPTTPAVETPQLGKAEIRVYNPNSGQQEVGRGIAGLDYVSGLDFGPDGRLYINDNPSEIKDPVTGQPLDPAKESRLLVYNVDSLHPVTDAPTLANSLTLGVGNSSGVNVAPDNTILVTNAAAGSITRYDANLQLIGSAITPALPAEALALDADGLARPTSPLYIAERFY